MQTSAGNGIRLCHWAPPSCVRCSSTSGGTNSRYLLRARAQVSCSICCLLTLAAWSASRLREYRVGNVAAAYDANDLAPDLLLNDWSPRNQTEAEPVINHREPPACELHGTEQFAADSLALLNGMKGKPPFGRELPTDALDLLATQGVDEVGSRAKFAGGASRALTSPNPARPYVARVCRGPPAPNPLPAAGLR
jgi:hypothetical protein